MPNFCNIPQVMSSQTCNQCFFVMGLKVVHIGDVATNAVDAHCVHHVTNVRLGTIGFLHDWQNHAQLDQGNANLTCEGFQQLHVRTWESCCTSKWADARVNFSTLLMRGLGVMAHGDQQGASVAWCAVPRSTPTPTIHFVHRIRLTHRKSASIGADVEHNTPHSQLPICECFVSRVFNCDPCERVAKVVRCLCHLGACPPFDTSHLQICFSFRDGPLDESQSLDAQSSNVIMYYFGV